MKISIIIPVYNVEKYLCRCIDSILSQKDNNIELLLVNDGSTDSSGEICTYYESIDIRVRVFHQANAGVSKARNFGLNKANGDWIIFVDGDDDIERYSLDKIELNENSDIVVLKSRKKYFNSTAFTDVYPAANELFSTVVSGNKAFVNYNYFRGSVCGVLYKKTFLDIHSLKFSEELRHGEDTLFVVMCQYFSKSMKFLDINFYNIYERDGSASSNIQFEDILQQLKSLSVVENYLRYYKIEIKKAPILNFFVYNIISNSLNRFMEINKSYESYKILKEMIKKSKLYPVYISNIDLRRFKIQVLNFSINWFSIFMLIKKHI